MWKQSRSIVATLALSAAALGASGLYSATLAAEKPKKAAVERREDEAEVTRQLAKALGDMLNEDGPAKLTGRLAANDRDRVEPGLKKAGDETYRKRVETFKREWKDKYGKSFDAEKNVDSLTGQTYDYFDWQDKQYITATFAKTQYEKESEVRFVESGPNVWRILLSDNLDGDELARRISGAINQMAQLKSQWPKDEGEAYRNVTRNLLAALDYDSHRQNQNEKKK